jgi:transcriptional regulator with XRE-family HTH domain
MSNNLRSARVSGRPRTPGASARGGAGRAFDDDEEGGRVDDGTRMHRGRGRTPKAGSGLDRVDAHIGSRVRIRRTLLGLSQTELGRSLGVTFQQIQKYEGGGNGIAASRLWQLAGVLGVPVSFFFDDLPPPGDVVAETLGPEIPMPPLGRRETLELLRCYYRIEDPRLRRRVFDLVKATVGALEDTIR